MADIEKVIKALEKCTEKHGRCDGCPYLGTGVWCKIQIDKDALKLLKELNEKNKTLEDKNWKLMLLLNHELQENQDIVRCKDCKYGHYATDSAFVFCIKPYVEVGSASHDKNWFCADGERRSSENDERDH